MAVLVWLAHTCSKCNVDFLFTYFVKYLLSDLSVCICVFVCQRMLNVGTNEIESSSEVDPPTPKTNPLQCTRQRCSCTPSIIQCVIPNAVHTTSTTHLHTHISKDLDLLSQMNQIQSNVLLPVVPNRVVVQVLVPLSNVDSPVCKFRLTHPEVKAIISRHIFLLRC